MHDPSLYKRFQEKDISLGNKLFNEGCIACHYIKRDFVGPALLQPVKTRKPEWLIKFIRNGDGLYRAGDRDAKSLYKKYSIIHPNATYLTKGDVEAILKYIREKK